MKTVTTEPEEYDILVPGSGEGAKSIAWTLAKRGKHAAVIERKYIGQISGSRSSITEPKSPRARRLNGR